MPEYSQDELFTRTKAQLAEKWFETDHGKEVLARFMDIVADCRRRDVKAGARMIWEKIRWDLNWDKVATAKYKMNDHYCPHIVDMAEKLDPTLKGFFEKRARGRKRVKRKIIVEEYYNAGGYSNAEEGQGWDR